MNQSLFLIICRKVTKELYEKYTDLHVTDLVFISDTKPDLPHKNIIYYTDQEMIKHGFMMMHSNIIVTSWDKAFFYVKHKLDYDYYWFIEDDCYLNKQYFSDYSKTFLDDKTDLLLFGWYKEFKQGDKWLNWKLNKVFHKNHLCASINQLVRLTSRMVQKIIDFTLHHKRFIFHEIMIPSIAKKHDFTIKQIKGENIHCTAFLNVVKINKNNRKELQTKYMILHPFKQWYQI